MKPAFEARSPTETTLNDGVVCHEVRAEGEAFADSLRALDRVHDFDVFHAFGLWFAAPCLDAAAGSGRAVVASIRGADGNFSRPGPSVLRVLREVSWLTSVSSDALRRAGALADVTERSSFIANGIDVRGLPAWELHDDNRGVVGTVAKFRKKKNLPLLLGAYSRLRPGSRRRLLLVGDFSKDSRTGPPLAIRFQQLVNGMRLTAEITRTGMVEPDRVPGYLCGMHVFVLSSNDEGLPNAVLEAAAVGVPIVATAVDGVKDVFSHEESALLVPPRDPAALTKAVQRLLDDAELAAHLSRGARELASSLTPEREAGAYGELYLRLVEATSATRSTTELTSYASV